ncbi:uncharacterized protein PAC_09091 [Phialocephala subalpina]|uniref:Uncharacterized protein n=1 Tax=Phialocephala subalpina TaxID=576137 RepID=A0A1L7X2G5_9HELO|nr:uncharacterized protein PAC_09091 [Phialocephala subalpina]
MHEPQFLDDYDSFWQERVLLAVPDTLNHHLYPWTGNHHLEVFNQKVTSLEEYKQALYHWVGKDNKVKDLEKKLPRQQTIKDMIAHLNKETLDSERITARATNPSNFLASWKHRVTKCFEVKSEEGVYDGFFHLTGQLYKIWDTKETEETNDTNDNKDKKKPAKTTRQKLLEYYASNGIGYGKKPPITSLEDSYLALVYAHVPSEKGDHRARDQMYDFIQRGVSDTITKDLCARFIAACPTCYGRWNSDKKRKYEEDEEDTPAPRTRQRRKRQRHQEHQNVRQIGQLVGEFATSTGLMPPAPQNLDNNLQACDQGFYPDASQNVLQPEGQFNLTIGPAQFHTAPNWPQFPQYFAVEGLPNVPQPLEQPNEIFEQTQNFIKTSPLEDFIDPALSELSFHPSPVGQVFDNVAPAAQSPGEAAFGHRPVPEDEIPQYYNYHSQQHQHANDILGETFNTFTELLNDLELAQYDVGLGEYNTDTMFPGYSSTLTANNDND